MSADHYVYEGYDTVPDSNEKLERANCGQVIHPRRSEDMVRVGVVVSLKSVNGIPLLS